MGRGLSVSAQDNRLNMPLLHHNNKKGARGFKLSTLSPWATHPALSAWHYCYPPHTHQSWCSRGCLGSGRGACWIQLSARQGSGEGLRMGVFPENIIVPHCSFITHSFEVTFHSEAGKALLLFLWLYEWFIYRYLLSFVDKWDCYLVFWCTIWNIILMTYISIS